MTPPRQPRVNWDAALAYYVALGQGTRTYALVAAKFAVSETSVRKWARRQDWPGEAARADAKAADRALAASVRSLEERNRDTVRAADKIRQRILEADLSEIDLTAAIRALPRFATLEQLFAGEATSRVDVGEVQAYVQAFLGLTGKFIPAGRRAEFLAEVRELEAGFGELGEQAA